jgi:predicted TIM-barrel fold metal-dependent hydrolase
MAVDRELALMILSIYNDACAEMQAESGGRLFPQALIPFWDMELALKELDRIHSMGLRGITMSSEPHSAGLPDITAPHWEPLWDACQSMGLPVNFHVGSSEFGKEAFEKGTWPGLDKIRKHVVGCVLLEMHNARVLANLLTSDLLVRFPRLKFVSVESGIGWIPYVLDRMDFEYEDQYKDLPLKMKPSEYWRRQCKATFQYDRVGTKLIDEMGVETLMWGSDYPHPDGVWPESEKYINEQFAHLPADVTRKMTCENAGRFYGLIR